MIIICYSAHNLFRVDENSLEQCCAAHIVQCCQQYCSALLSLNQQAIRCNNAEQYCWQHWTMWAAQHCSRLFSSTQNRLCVFGCVRQTITHLYSQLSLVMVMVKNGNLDARAGGRSQRVPEKPDPLKYIRSCLETKFDSKEKTFGSVLRFYIKYIKYMKYSEKIEIAVPLRVWVVLLRVLTTVLTNSFETLTAHGWRLRLHKRVRLCSIFEYFVNYKQLTQKNRKYFIIVKEIAITEEREKN